MNKPELPFPARSMLTFATGLVLACQAGSARAQDAPDASREPVQSRVQETPGVLPGQSRKPLAGIGLWLAERGIAPRFSINQFSQANPSTGVDTGERQVVTLVSLGADLDMGKIAGIDGGTIHFEQLYVPIISNLNYRAQLGDALSAIGAPYLPKASHLQTLTYEQKLFDDKLTVEVGKSNAIYYFATSLCNMPLSCLNTILITAGGVNPFPYADWSARLAYDVSPRLRVQAGAWRSNPNFFNHNGWERRGDPGDPTSTSYFANVVYRSTFAEEAYPATYEAMGYHNNGRQNDRFVTPGGLAAGQVHDGTSGMYLGARKVLYRPDGGRAGVAHPRALSAYASMTHSFDSTAGNGIRNLLHAGVIRQGLFAGRPLDSYSLNVHFAQLTRHRQRFTEDAHRAIGEGSYDIGRNEYALTLDANYVLTDSIVVSPFVRHTWNANKWFNAFGRTNPSDGFTLGFALHVGLDHALGLRAKP